MRAWGLSATPMRTLSHAGVVRCRGGKGTREGGGAACLLDGFPAWCTLPPLKARRWGVLQGPATHWLWLRWAGVVARTPHCVCGLAGRTLRRLGMFLGRSRVPLFCACCARCRGLRHTVADVARHVCLGCGRWYVCLACLVAPRWCTAPCPVQSLSVLQSAFPSPWCLPLPGAGRLILTGRLCAAREGWRRTKLRLPAAGPGCCVVPVRSPAVGLSLAGSSGIRLWLPVVRWFGMSVPSHLRVRFLVPSALPVPRGFPVWMPRTRGRHCARNTNNRKAPVVFFVFFELLNSWFLDFPISNGRISTFRILCMFCQFFFTT